MTNVTTSLLISLIIAILIIIIYSIVIKRLYTFWHTNTNFRVNKILITDLYDTLKTGDIILFTNCGFNPSNAILSHTFFTHIGILIRENDILYISETNGVVPFKFHRKFHRKFHKKFHKKTQNNNDKPLILSNNKLYTKNGVDYIPLLTRLKFYTGECFIMQLNKTLNLEKEEKIKKEVKILYKNNYPYPTPLKGVIAIMGIKVNARHCFQHIAYLLMLINLLPPKYYNLGFIKICKKIANISGVKLHDNYYYKDVVQILYNI